MTMLCPTAPARMTSAPARALPLWRWLLGGLVPLYAVILTHSGIIAGSRSEVLLWQKWQFAMGVPALVVLLLHLTNRYFIQGIGGVSIGRFLRLLLTGIPTLT